MADGSLIPIETVNAIELFTGEKPSLDGLLEKIRQETATIVPDVSTVKGRADIASVAYKIARSKTAIDDAGKELVAEWKTKSAEVDKGRKKARDYLDTLKDEVRKPLDDYEAEQERIKQEKIDAERLRIEAEAEAKRIEMEAREAAIRAKEEAFAKAEEDARLKALAEQAEKDRIAREEQVRKEAEERAQREAAEAIARAQREAEEAKEAARQAAVKAEQDRIAAEARAKHEAEQAEIARLAAIQRAEQDKAEAVRQAEAKAQREAEAVEAARRSEALRVQAEADRVAAEEAKRAANKAHRAKINNGALDALKANGIDADTAKKVVTLIASGAIANVSIAY